MATNIVTLKDEDAIYNAVVSSINANYGGLDGYNIYSILFYVNIFNKNIYKKSAFFFCFLFVFDFYASP